MQFKAIMKPFVPPVLWSLLTRFRNVPLAFNGDYDSWEAAARVADGYDSDEILRKVIAATRKVVAGEASFERDSLVFDHVEYSWPLLAGLMLVASERRSLRVLDFGGSLGSTLRQNWKFLSRLHVPISWNVVEQENFVAAGRREFTTDILKFHGTIEEAARDGIDVALFCSSLCYVPDPAAFLDAVAASGAAYMMIDRLPIVARDRDRIALQRISAPIYDASYPVRFFSERNLIDNLLAQWVLIERWKSDLQPGGDASWEGMFLERR